MDLGRLTARQQLKYLEEQAKKEVELQQKQVEAEGEISARAINSIGSCRKTVAPSRQISVKKVYTPNDIVNVDHNINAMVDNKRKGEDVQQARLDRLKKKRRVIKDDDDDDESETEMDFGEPDAASKKKVSEEKAAISKRSEADKQAGEKIDDKKNKTAESVQNNFLKRLQDKKKEREIQQKKKSTKEEQKEKEKEANRKGRKSPIPSIPKKSSAGGIPRKSADSNKKKEISSLLSEYKAPTVANTGSTASSGPGVISTGTALSLSSKDRDLGTAGMKPPKIEAEKNRFPPRALESASNLSGTNQMTRQMNSQVASTAQQRPTPRTIQAQQKGTSSSSRPKPSMAIRVMESLSEACAKLADEPDSNFRLSGRGSGKYSSSSIDWSSLLSHREYDFYDVDSKGSIVMQPQIPIFPEDFPLGMPAWPLSWWGIVDPSLVEGQQNQDKREENIKSKEDRPAPSLTKGPAKVEPARSSSTSDRNPDRSTAPLSGDGDSQGHRSRKREWAPPSTRDGAGGVGGEYNRDGRGDDSHRRHPGRNDPLGPPNGRGSGLPPPAFQPQRHPPSRGPTSYDRRRGPSPPDHPSRGLPPPAFEPHRNHPPPRGGPPFDRRRGPSPLNHSSRGLPPPHMNARGPPYPDRGPPMDYHRGPSYPERGPPFQRRDRRSGSRDRSR